MRYKSHFNTVYELMGKAHKKKMLVTWQRLLKNNLPETIMMSNNPAASFTAAIFYVLLSMKKSKGLSTLNYWYHQTNDLLAQGVREQQSLLIQQGESVRPIVLKSILTSHKDVYNNRYRARAKLYRLAAPFVNTESLQQAFNNVSIYWYARADFVHYMQLEDKDRKVRLFWEDSVVLKVMAVAAGLLAKVYKSEAPITKNAELGTAIMDLDKWYRGLNAQLPAKSVQFFYDLRADASKPKVEHEDDYQIFNRPIEVPEPKNPQMLPAFDTIKNLSEFKLSDDSIDGVIGHLLNVANIAFLYGEEELEDLTSYLVTKLDNNPDRIHGFVSTYTEVDDQEKAANLIMAWMEEVEISKHGDISKEEIH
jgi:hypothetical protein